MARLLALLSLTTLLGLPPTGSAGELYSYVDEDGVIVVTNTAPHATAVTRSAARRAPSAPRSPYVTAAYDEHICAAAERHRVAPSLVKAVVAVESNFDPAAVSAKGATGLMQLMPATARELDVADLLDPGENIGGGARYLRQLHDLFDGDLETVLAAYNAGPEAVRRAGSTVPPFKETRTYVRRVLAARDAYSRASWCGGAGSGLSLLTSLSRTPSG